MTLHTVANDTYNSEHYSWRCVVDPGDGNPRPPTTSLSPHFFCSTGDTNVASHISGKIPNLERLLSLHS